ncbi:hypothetical protein TNCV_3549431 [Trichonephila clavipes]|nr:hypothetical protein TNCV_3549431 [Trichonephila clavipes]
MFEKVAVLMDCPTVSWEEFVAVDDSNACTASIIIDKNILEFVKSSKNIIEADCDVENEMCNADLFVFTSSEMKNVIKKFLETNGLLLDNRRRQSFVNAANMSGQYNGVQALLKEKNKFANYVPWAAHSLNPVCAELVKVAKPKS